MAQAAELEALLGPRMTLEEWAELPDDVPGEFVDGRLVDEEMPNVAHEVIVMWLGYLFLGWAEKTATVVAGSGVKFAVSNDRGRKPDATVFLPGAKRPPAKGMVRMPPNIAIEVVSPSRRDRRRDRVEKLADYAAFGIHWYWIVDPEQRLVEIHALGDDGRYVKVVERSSGAIDEIPGCPGLVLDLDVIWSKVDALADDD